MSFNGKNPFEERASHSADESTKDPDEKDMCVICWDSEINTVLLECGHRAVCLDCSNSLAECPMCRKEITRVVRVFDAH